MPAAFLRVALAGRGLQGTTLLAAVALACGGCWKSTPSPVAQPAPPTVSDASSVEPEAEIATAEKESSPDVSSDSKPAGETAVAPDDVSTSTTDETNENAAANGASGATEEPSEVSADAAVEEVAEASPAGPRGDARLLVATPGGPTIVDAELIVDGESPQQALDAFTTEILELADTNDDGTATWDEVFADPVFKAGTLGNDAIPGEPEAKRARELYDNNRDNVVQAEEVPRFVTRNAGAARSFTLQSANFFRFYQKTESALRLIADADRDGKLTRPELAQAPRELTVYDADDDEILTAEEIETDDRDSFRRQRPLNSRTDPETALLIDDRLKPEDLRRWLSESYAFSGSLEAGMFPKRPDLEAALDSNGDDRFELEELATFRALPADVVIRIEFGAPAEREEAPVDAVDLAALYMMQSAGGGTRVEVLETGLKQSDGGSAPTVRSSSGVPSRTLLEADGFLLRIAANDGAPSYGQATGIFRQADANGDEKLDESERNASPFLLQIPAEAIDLDKDDVFTLDEVASYFRRVAGAQRAKVRALAMEDRDAVLVALDENLDGRIQPGERANLEALLDRYDANRDDQLSTGELPAVVSLTFVRGDLQQSEELFRRPPQRLAPVGAGEAPAWLAQMDRNEDGVVTRREFPGPPEKFDQLDADGDGEIVPAEAIAATKSDESTNAPEPTREEPAPEPNP